MSYYTLGLYIKGDENRYLEMRFENIPTIEEVLNEIKFQQTYRGLSNALAHRFSNSIIEYGIPVITDTMDEVEITWGLDERSKGIMPIGITNLHCFRIVSNKGIQHGK